MVKGANKIDPFSDPELRDYFSPHDPESVFVDFREIGHGGFGSVYYVSTAVWRRCLGLCCGNVCCVAVAGVAG